MSPKSEVGTISSQSDQAAAFADCLPQLVLSADLDGTLRFLNLKYEELTGENREQAIAGQLWRNRIHPDDLAGLLDGFGAVDGRSEFQSEFRLGHADGSHRWMRLVAKLDVRGGEDPMWHGVAVDVEAERTARLELHSIRDGLQSRINRQAAELARTEARYSSLFAVSRIAFAEQDMSDAATILHGLRAEGVEDLAAYMGDHAEVLARCVAAVRTISVNEACVRMLGFADAEGAVDRPVDRTAEDIETVLLRQFEMIFYGLESVEGRVVLIGSEGRRVPVFYSVSR